MDKVRLTAPFNVIEPTVLPPGFFAATSGSIVNGSLLNRYLLHHPQFVVGFPFMPLTGKET